jgi:FkbM family methyltransferase
VASLSRGRSPSGNKVEPLTGFNKLVRGRHGLYIANENDMFIGRALIHYGEYGELEWKLLQRFCEPGAVVVEVGANIGSHTVSLGKAVGASGKVVAVEPQPVIFQALCANLALNGLTNVDAVNCGCGNRRQTLHLPRVDYATEGNFGGIELQGHAATPTSVPVEIRKLDDLIAPCKMVNLLKVDVEGMESEVIEGGSKAIKNFRPVIYVENDRQQKSRVLIDLIRGMGYRLWWHVPLLYNPDNYFANSENLYPHVGSFNMLCIHGTIAANFEGLEEVVDSTYHPLAN